MTAKVSQVWSVPDWRDTHAVGVIQVEKEEVEGGVRYKAYAVDNPDLEPRYGETSRDAINAVERQQWEFTATGRDAKAANAVK